MYRNPIGPTRPEQQNCIKFQRQVQRSISVSHLTPRLSYMIALSRRMSNQPAYLDLLSTNCSPTTSNAAVAVEKVPSGVSLESCWAPSSLSRSGTECKVLATLSVERRHKNEYETNLDNRKYEKKRIGGMEKREHRRRIIESKADNCETSEEEKSRHTQFLFHLFSNYSHTLRRCWPHLDEEL